jgi:hypothetical protein
MPTLRPKCCMTFWSERKAARNVGERRLLDLKRSAHHEDVSF